MPLILEPSLFAVQRGQQWVQRAVERGVTALALSATAVNEFHESYSPRSPNSVEADSAIAR